MTKGRFYVKVLVQIENHEVCFHTSIDESYELRSQTFNSKVSFLKILKRTGPNELKTYYDHKQHDNSFFETMEWTLSIRQSL